MPVRPLPPVRAPRRPLRRGRSRRRLRASVSARRSLLGTRVAGARKLLFPYRQASFLAVALTGLLLLLFTPPEQALALPGLQDTQEAEAPDEAQEEAPATQPPRRAEDVAREAEQEAVRTFTTIRERLLRALPKVAVALAILVFAWLVVRAVRLLLRAALKGWERAPATIALVGIALWLLAAGLALSVLTGDVRGLIGSVGLVGLALSWALQTPIESFTGWLLNSLQRYYQVGDRIEVGEVFGDVAQIDYLTTTLWELGGPQRGGFVQAEQPTGRLITLPNSVILTGTVINLTRSFPWVWDELVVHVEKETDVPYALALLRRVGTEVLGASMVEPTRQYEALLRRARVDSPVAPLPEVYVTLEEDNLQIIIRYLIGARERRRWKTALVGRVLTEVRQPAHASRILLSLPRQQVQFVGADGQVRDRLEARVALESPLPLGEG